MSDDVSVLFDGKGEELSLTETNIIWLPGLSGINARLKVRAIQCPSYPRQHYWTFILQVFIPGGLGLSIDDSFAMLTQADIRAAQLRQTQKWVFVFDEIEFIPSNPDRSTPDPLKEINALSKRIVASQRDTNGGRAGLTPAASPLQLNVASEHLEDAVPFRPVGDGLNRDWNDEQPMPDFDHLDREATAAPASTESNGDGSAQGNSSETNDSTPPELELPQTYAGSNRSEVNPLKRKAVTTVASYSTPSLGPRIIAVPRTRHRMDDTMDWEAEPTTQSPHQGRASAQIDANTESDDLGFTLVAEEGLANDEGNAAQPLETTLSTVGMSSSHEGSRDRIEILVRAVLEGSRKFQEDKDRRDTWMTDLKARSELCANAEALEATFLKQVHAVSMNHWVSRFFYGCSQVIFGAVQGRKRRKGVDRTIELEASPQEVPLIADSSEADVENDSYEDSGIGKHKRHRCRKLARIVISLINCLITQLDNTGAADEAFNIIPALAGQCHTYCWISCCLTSLSGQLRVLSE